MRNIAVSLLYLMLASSVLATDFKLSAPVRVLRPRPVQQPQNRPPRRESPPPTITRGLLPQYQSAIPFRSNLVQAPPEVPPPLRFLLALPDQILVLEATVTIDDQPFEIVRERRIDRIIAELKQPARVESETPPAAEGKVADGGERPEAAEPEADEKMEDGEADDSAEPEVELIPVPSPALEARLRRYSSVTGRLPSRDEVRWLLAKWVDGPKLLILDENFQRFRGGQAPAFDVLDLDLDGKISAQELKVAYETLRACDENENDVVEYTEIAAVADDPRRKSASPPTHALIPVLDDEALIKSLQRLAARYETGTLPRFALEEDGTLDPAEITAIRESQPDVALVIAFDSDDAANSTTTLTHVNARLKPTEQSYQRVGPSITLSISDTLVEFSAVQSTAASHSDQISVGIVNDGYPFLPAIDPDQDGRLTIRELRRIKMLAARLDRDGNGEISPRELPPTIRVAFGLGPTVHRHLADIRRIHPNVNRRKVDVPTWFTKMDRNKDGDISPREFLFGPERFKQTDTDNDELISVAEALAAEAATQPENGNQP